MNPPAILDPVIMNLSQYYQNPLCLEPLDADPDKKGVKSDHRIVFVKPISSINNKSSSPISVINNNRYSIFCLIFTFINNCPTKRGFSSLCCSHLLYSV